MLFQHNILTLLDFNKLLSSKLITNKSWIKFINKKNIQNYDETV
jgi:hypothetical protein